MVLACLSDKFEKVMTEEKFQIYHFALENDGKDTKRYLVWENQLLTETPFKLKKNYFPSKLNYFIFI